MGNLADYKRICGEHISRVKAIRNEHDKILSELNCYAGSDYGSEKASEENERFNAELKAAHEGYTTDIDKVLANMKMSLEEKQLQTVPPSEEQLRLLTAVSLMSHISIEDYTKYLGACGSSDVALHVLHNLAKERAGEQVLIPDLSSPLDSAYEQAKGLTENARSLSRWDGETYEEATKNYLESRHANGIAATFSINRNPAFAGGLHPTSEKYFEEVLGMLYDEKSLELVD